MVEKDDKEPSVGEDGAGAFDTRVRKTELSYTSAPPTSTGCVKHVQCFFCTQCFGFSGVLVPGLYQIPYGGPDLCLDTQS